MSTVVVSAGSRVRPVGHEYSMPLTTLGQAATLHLYPDGVETMTKTGQVVSHGRGSDRSEPAAGAPRGHARRDPAAAAPG